METLDNRTPGQHNISGEIVDQVYDSLCGNLKEALRAATKTEAAEVA